MGKRRGRAPFKSRGLGRPGPSKKQRRLWARKRMANLFGQHLRGRLQERSFTREIFKISDYQTVEDEDEQTV